MLVNIFQNCNALAVAFSLKVSENCKNLNLWLKKRVLLSDDKWLLTSLHKPKVYFHVNINVTCDMKRRKIKWNNSAILCYVAAVHILFPWARKQQLKHKKILIACFCSSKNVRHKISFIYLCSTSRHNIAYCIQHTYVHIILKYIRIYGVCITATRDILNSHHRKKKMLHQHLCCIVCICNVCSFHNSL